MFESCGKGFDVANLSANDAGFMDSTVLHNNVIACDHAVYVQQDDPPLLMRNNVFLSDELAVRLGGQADPQGYIAGGLDSDFNFFATKKAYAVFVSFGEQGSWALGEFQSAFGAEQGSLEGDPKLDATDEYGPLPGSPVVGVGDASLYPGQTSVNIGRHPFQRRAPR